MRILVTGATGFFGSHIAEQLAREGHTMRVLVRRTSDRSFLRGLECEEALGDVTQPETLSAAVEGVEAVVHAAGLVKARSAQEFQAVNAQGTSNLLSALDSISHLRRFVYISSLAAHGPSEDGRPRPLDAPPNPVTAYGRSKLRAEELVRSWAGDGRSAAIIRPPVIYGPRDRELLPFFRLTRRRLAPLWATARTLSPWCTLRTRPAPSRRPPPLRTKRPPPPTPSTTAPCTPGATCWAPWNRP